MDPPSPGALKQIFICWVVGWGANEKGYCSSFTSCGWGGGSNVAHFRFGLNMKLVFVHLNSCSMRKLNC